MQDKYIHFERVIQEKLFTILTHHESTQNLKIKECRELSRKLIRAFPLSAIVKSEHIDIGELYYGDNEANNNENFGGRVSLIAFNQCFK